jgi:G3E family GTPase
MDPLPVTFVSGFFSAGKSTMLASLMRRLPLGSTRVLIEDCGRQDLYRRIASQALARRPRHLFIELHGLEVPPPAAELAEATRGWARAESAVTVIDAAAHEGTWMLSGSRARELLLEQARTASAIVLNKIDRSEPAALAALEARLHQLNPRAWLVRASWGNVPLSLLDLDGGAAPTAPPRAGLD